MHFTSKLRRENVVNQSLDFGMLWKKQNGNFTCTAVIFEWNARPEETKILKSSTDACNMARTGLYPWIKNWARKITCLAGISLCSGWLYFFPISYLRNIFVGHRQINVRVFKTVCVHCFCLSNAGVCVTWCMIKLLITKTLIQQKFLLYSKTLLTWATLGNKKRFKWAGLKLADRKRPKKWSKRILDLVGVTGDLSVNRAQVSRVLI